MDTTDMFSIASAANMAVHLLVLAALCQLASTAAADVVPNMNGDYVLSKTRHAPTDKVRVLPLNCA